ncbi:hypothetical protein LIS66_27390 (plasmid) [Pseudomonas sp. HN2]|uniref:hypothetical protein n=1 Tax=Pseudomonas sp. HN2 TaxID=2884805 RepID=UPI001D13899A|nr:hypothetical protein [Pseudomonas sp. HN2]UEB98757.1 hypothetical protein LIS66_27390 [Pseudomonas sp. HN2]
MTLPLGSEFEQDLRDLRALSPEVASLAERIAQAVRPEVTESGALVLTWALFELMDALAQDWPKSVRVTCSWLGDLRVLGALTDVEAEGFKVDVRRLGGVEGRAE